MKTELMHIHLIHPATLPEDFIAETLSDGEKSRAARFCFLEDAIHWASCRAALRKILGDAVGFAPKDIPLVFSKFGKPLLAAPFDHLHFNLSHTSQMALLVIAANGPIGIDLESIERSNDLLGCEDSFCHPDEIQNLPANLSDRSAQLLKIWTAKEAVIKALGTGFSHPPESILLDFHSSFVTAKSEIPLAGLAHQRIRPLNHPMLVEYQAFVSSSEIEEAPIVFSDFTL